MSGWLPFERQLGGILGLDSKRPESDPAMQGSGSEDEDDEEESDSDQITNDETAFSDTESDPFAPAEEDDGFDPFQSETPTGPDIHRLHYRRYQPHPRHPRPPTHLYFSILRGKQSRHSRSPNTDFPWPRMRRSQSIRSSGRENGSSFSRRHADGRYMEGL